MRDILFLAHRLPWPPDRGDKIRSYHVLRYLSGLARVHLLAFAEEMHEIAAADELRSLVASSHVEWRPNIPGPRVVRALLTGTPASVAMFASRGMQRRVAQLLEREDIGTIVAFFVDRLFVSTWLDVGPGCGASIANCLPVSA